MLGIRLLGLAGLAFLATAPAYAVTVTLLSNVHVVGNDLVVPFDAGDWRAVMQEGSGWSFHLGEPATWLTGYHAEWTDTAGPQAVAGGEFGAYDSAGEAFAAAQAAGALVIYLSLAEASDVFFHIGDNVGSDNQGEVILEVVNPLCGDGVVDDPSGEFCDDGNTLDGDDCSADCLTGVPEPSGAWMFLVGTGVLGGAALARRRAAIASARRS
jgi:cysteine-rich repeat protein